MPHLFTATTRRKHAEGVIDLRRRRAWFAENDQDGQQNPTTTTPDDSGEDWKLEDLPKAVQSYIKGLRAEARERRLELDEANKAARDREQARLKEEGRWRELAESRERELAEYAPHKERAQKLEGLIRTENETRINQIREDMRGLVPSNYAPEDLSAWLTANWSRLMPQRAPELDAGAGGTGRTPTLTEDEKVMARRANMTEAEYIKAKQRAGMT